MYVELWSKIWRVSHAARAQGVNKIRALTNETWTSRSPVISSADNASPNWKIPGELQYNDPARNFNILIRAAQASIPAGIPGAPRSARQFSIGPRKIG